LKKLNCCLYEWLINNPQEKGMNMDKTGYWKNRKAGKRGQGDTPSKIFYPKGETPTHLQRKVQRLSKGPTNA
jgi:hypothetical protein